MYCSNYRIRISLFLTITLLFFSCKNKPLHEVPVATKQQIDQLIDSGDFSLAQQAIQQVLEQTDLPVDKVTPLEFELTRMDRIRKDFSVSKDEVTTYIKKLYPQISPADLVRWEGNRALEYRIIDGKKWYFDQAARNLFRIDPQMKQVWDDLHPDTTDIAGSGAGLDLDQHDTQIIHVAQETGQHYVEPRRLRITQTIDLDANTVPAGEMVRCWIPYPREIAGRQTAIRLLHSDPQTYELAPGDALQRTIYFEAYALKDTPLHFSVSYELTTHGVYYDIDPDSVTIPESDETLQAFLAERPPQIKFTAALRKLSEEIVGDEQNPYRKAQLLFSWIDTHVPWASAREYSTIACIPEYAYENGHGDCGIQTLLFMTLCRMNGIPARWQSGWELQPPHDSMHDWGMLFFAPYGWVPMDVTYGLRNSPNEQLHWFYLGGMDSYRIIFNDDFSQAFSPPKKHFRSETIDSQRGEVEWSGGNLYFDQWHWGFDWEILGEPTEKY